MSGKWRLEIAGLENEKQREAQFGFQRSKALQGYRQFVMACVSDPYCSNRVIKPRQLSLAIRVWSYLRLLTSEATCSLARASLQGLTAPAGSMLSPVLLTQ
jgi:hypothetical protein